MAGIGQSNWGPIAPAADSLTQRSTAPGMPLWEGMLVWPFRVITFPVVIVGTGVAAGVEVLDERKVIQWVQEQLRPRTGPFGLKVDVTAGGLTGFGVGMTGEYTGLFTPDGRARLEGAASTTGHRLVNAGLGVPVGPRGRIEVAGGYRVRPNARYFGLGPDASRGDQSFYRQESGWAGVSYTLSGSHLEAMVEVFGSTIGAFDPRDQDQPSLPDQFPDTPTGYGEYSTGVTVGAGIAHVDEDGSGRPTRGGARRARVWHFSNLDGSGLDFWTFRIEAEQFVPLWYRYHTLALRGVVGWIDRTSPDEVPFQRLMTNRFPDELRGFDSFRWRDRGILLLSAEYRWPIWANKTADGTGVDLYVLGDVGQVFRRAGDINGRNLTTSMGAGLRLGSMTGFVARMELAWSDEGAQFRLQTDQPFQFFKRGLYHGREPTPQR